jgi:dGTPase
MDWAKLLSSKRFRGEPTASENGRSEFQKDYDRIAFSRAFRRLQGKTQVHPLPDNDHVHTRLTHTIEVASVGRSLGAQIGLDLERAGMLPIGVFPQDVGSIVQAACLAHDIGNPPFGHGGEEAIRAWFKGNSEYMKGCSDIERLDLENYEGNAQGLRVISQLEGHLLEGGLRPTFATLGAFIKYPWSSGYAISAGKRKFGYFQTEKENMEEIAAELGLLPHGMGGWVRHPLVYLVEAADDICYEIMDIEDAVDVGILGFDEFEKIFIAGLSTAQQAEYGTIRAPDFPRQLGFLRGKCVDYLVRQVIEAFKVNENRILAGEFNGKLLSECEDKAKNIMAAANQLARERVFSQSSKVQIEIGVYAIMDVLLSAFCDAYIEFKEKRCSFKSQRVFDLLGVNKPDDGDTPYSALIRIADFVSGSTDKNAAQLSQRLNGTLFN